MMKILMTMMMMKIMMMTKIKMTLLCSICLLVSSLKFFLIFLVSLLHSNVSEYQAFFNDYDFYRSRKLTENPKKTKNKKLGCSLPNTYRLNG
jgi:hypothetical protein